MSDDIVARLRNYQATVLAAPPYYRELVAIAADEIERLRRHYSGAEKDHVECVAGYHDAKMEIEWLRARVAELEGLRDEH